MKHYCSPGVEHLGAERHKIRYRDENDVEISKTVPIDCIDSAALRREILARIGRSSRGTALTFKSFIPKYSEWAARQKAFSKKEDLILQIAGTVFGKDKVVFGSINLFQITPLILETYQTHLLNRKLKPATVNRHIATIKHMLTKANDWGYIADEILRGARKVKNLPENNQRIRFLSREESDELLENCPVMIKPVVVTALNTGMRCGEILGLTWDRVDLKRNIIRLEDGMTKNGQGRVIPINATLKNTLTNIVRGINSTLVFANFKHGGRYKTLNREFNRACARSGISDFHFHDLRHTFASNLAMNGVALGTIGKLLGHKTMSMTERYSHFSEAHISEAVKRLDFEDLRTGFGGENSMILPGSPGVNRASNP